ncbi:MAG: glutamyl-tRNA reductase [Verrucomicrobiota bacterium]|nr:glutamyl-tRNA reductase [Verrucomicrobiota bacterium]
MLQTGCVLKIGVLGLNHKTACLLLREAMARGASALAGEKALFFPHPTVLLSTCNRTEIYFSSDDLAETHSDLLAALRRHWIHAGPFEYRLYSYFGIDCFLHLGRVAAGLDSAILAESEIQRQVKVAYAKACELFSLPSCMHYVFQKSLKVGKLIRSEFQLARQAPTLSQAVWQLAKEKLGDLKQRRILLVGHSEINRSIAFFLVQRGITHFAMATREPSSVCIEGCSPRNRSELDRWADYDLIVAATSGDQYLLFGSSTREHVLFDLSVPRTIDPSLAQEPNTTLYNIEQVNQWINRKRSTHMDQLPLCDEILRQNVLRLARAFRAKLECRAAVH